MKEQQAVLDFFAQEENLSLALAVAEQIDELRQRKNNEFWQSLQQQLGNFVIEHALPWRLTPTEDSNAADILVGLHCLPTVEQDLFLRPMMEQQNIGGDWRIYYGLMWNTKPSLEQLALPAVIALQHALRQAGFKNNENYLGWQWTNLHPRQKGFLLRCSQHPAELLNEALHFVQTLLLDHRESIAAANTALSSAPHNLTKSLKQLRSELLD